jgi:hypothetical protein
MGFWLKIYPSTLIVHHFLKCEIILLIADLRGIHIKAQIEKWRDVSSIV